MRAALDADASPRDRLQSARERLDRFGLRAARKGSAARADASAGRRLREALDGLGPLFAEFGDYLGSRIDLLPLNLCLQIGTTEAYCEPLATDRVGSLLAEDLGGDPARLFAAFSAAPIRSRPAFQWHRATAATGEELIVRLLRSDFVAGVDRDLEILPVLEELRIDDATLGPTELPSVVEDFVVWLERRMELERELEALDKIADEAAGFDSLVVPRRFRRLSAGRVMTLEDPGGDHVDRWCESIRRDAGPEAAGRLWLAWLQQAIVGSLTPEGPLADGLMALSDDRFAVTGGLYAGLGAGRRRRLYGALRATARNDPDLAGEALLEACDAEVKGDRRDDLRRLFRQAEPFRSGGWGERFVGSRLAHTVYIQWRLLRAEGISIPSPIVGFVRGLFEVDRIASRLAPEQDAFAQGLADFRVVAAAVELREQLGSARLRSNLERLVPVIDEVARRADELSRLAADGRLRLTTKRAEERPPERRSADTWAWTASLVLLAIAVLLVLDRLVGTGADRRWLEAIGATLFVGASATTLWLVSRQRSK